MRPTRKTITEEQFRELLLQDEWIHRFANPVRRYDRDGRYLGMHTCSYPVEYEVRPVWEQEARALAAGRRQELLSSLKKGDLAFVAMGGDCGSSVPDDVCNHRIRCNFRNSAGGRYFIEFIRSADGGFYVDSAIDYAKGEEYERQCREVYEWNRSRTCFGEHRRFPEQMQHDPFGVANMPIGKPFTFGNVVAFVNSKFGCSYTSGRLFRHFVGWEEYENEC